MNSTVNKILDAIKLAMEAKGMTQEGLANKLGWGSQAEVSKLLQGKRVLRVGDLDEIARVLGMDLRVELSGQVVGEAENIFDD